MTVFAVMSIKGGVGKTTTAVNLAWLSAAEGRRTVLWDLDAQGAASFAFRIRPKVAGGVRRLLRDEDAAVAALRGTDFEHLDVLPADPSWRRADDAVSGRARLDRTVRALQRDHEHVVLDCPPGVSRLAERVFACADVLLVPTVPTVLALRTLADLVRRVRRLPRRPPRVLAFLSMSDHRKALHRRIAAWAAGHPELFLRTEIPYASLVEQLSVQRRPVGVYAPRSEAAAAYEALWREIGERLLRPVADVDPIQRSVRDLLVELDPARHPAPAPDDDKTADGASGASGASATDVTGALETSAGASAAGAGGGSGGSSDAARGVGGATSGPRAEHEFKLALRGAQDVEALLAHVPEAGARAVDGVAQINHVYDTARRDLARHGVLLRLREEAGAFTVTLKGPLHDPAVGAALASKAEEEVRIDASWAVEILGGRRSPLETLVRRLGASRPPVVAAAQALVGGQELVRIGSFRNVRRRVGPLPLPAAARALDVVLEFDRTEFPGGRTDWEVEVEVAATDASDCGPALQRLFASAGVPWHATTSKARRFEEALALGAGGRPRTDAAHRAASGAAPGAASGTAPDAARGAAPDATVGEAGASGPADREREAGAGD